MKVSRIRDVKLPQRANANDAGVDFFVPNDFKSKWLGKNEGILIPSGIKVNVPDNHAFIAFNKSGVAVKRQLLGGACVVDEGYQGELHIHIINLSQEPQEIKPGEKIMQFILVPMFYDGIEEVSVDELFSNESTRGDGGFGSTGI
jgi:dUTP pyrophosphatase